MRQTYKPLKRRESKAFALSKKTIEKDFGNVIPLDEDKLENIDEYWEKAKEELDDSILSIDDMVSDEVSQVDDIKKEEKKESMIHDEFKRNYKKSFDKEFTSNFDTAEVTGISESVIMEENDTCDRGNDENMRNIIENKETSEHTEIYNENELLCDEDASKASIEEIKQPNIKKRKKTEDFQLKDPSIMEELEKKPRKQNEHRKNGGYTICSGVAIGNIPSMVREKNELIPLIRNAVIETGLMYLNYGAYIKDELANETFSIFVIKGTLNIKTEGNEFVIKKGDVAIIQKGWVYEIIGMGRNGNSLLINYCINNK
ncbi:hypothetical protein TCON_1644 [Astathelohania contejeani]|uniref:Mif2/CENP-C cupin domain-containing protein n=1 Tax=Astathelohania contejeani TaxID=164912 RepID=A0ABQ7HY84_9MICR|nr:hypothetical protein TCON_1644 [Thelohania contejeani]